MGIFNIFIKKENKFLAILNEFVATAVSTSELLVDFMGNTKNVDEREALSHRIKELESAGDKIYNKIFHELNTTFITPFDREDIQALAAKMDDVLDFINGVAKRTVMFKIEEIPADFIKMAELVNKQCLSLQVSLSGLGKITKNPDTLIRECYRIHEYEKEADEVYEMFLTELFSTCKDPVELIKKHKIIQFLEDTTDVTEEVADVIKTIIVKYN